MFFKIFPVVPLFLFVFDFQYVFMFVWFVNFFGPIDSLSFLLKLTQSAGFEPGRGIDGVSEEGVAGHLDPHHPGTART